MRVIRSKNITSVSPTGFRRILRASGTANEQKIIREQVLHALRDQRLKFEVHDILRRRFGDLPLAEPFALELFLKITIRQGANEKPPVSVRFNLFPADGFAEADQGLMGFFLMRSMQSLKKALQIQPKDRFASLFAETQREIVTAILRYPGVGDALAGVTQKIKDLGLKEFTIFSQFVWKPGLKDLPG